MADEEADGGPVINRGFSLLSRSDLIFSAIELQ